MITERLDIRRCIHTMISMLLLQLLIQASSHINTYVQELSSTTSRASRFPDPFVVAFRFVIRRRPTHQHSLTRHRRTITHKISFNIEWPLLVSTPYSYIRYDTGHKTHIVVILNGLIWIQYQPYPDDTFNMIFIGYIQFQYLTTCYFVKSK
jgi:hypothetical protein